MEQEIVYKAGVCTVTKEGDKFFVYSSTINNQCFAFYLKTLKQAKRIADMFKDGCILSEKPKKHAKPRRPYGK